MIPQVDNLPHNLVRNVAKYNIYDRDYRGLASFHFFLSSVRLIYERLRVPANLCEAAFPRSLIVLSCNIIAGVSGAARPVPHGRAHEILRRGRSKSPAATYSLGFVSSLLEDRLYCSQVETTPVVSDFVHTHTLGVQEKSIDCKILQPTKSTSKRWSLLFIKVLLLVKDEGMLAREKVNPGVQIRSLGIHVDDSMVETPYMSIQYTHTWKDCAFSRPWLRVWTSLPSGCIIEYILSRKRTVPKFPSAGRSWYFAVITRKNIREFLARAGNILSRCLKARRCPSRCIVAAIRRG